MFLFVYFRFKANTYPTPSQVDSIEYLQDMFWHKTTKKNCLSFT